MGARVTVSELRNAQGLDPKTLDELAGMGVRLETGGHKESTFGEADTIVVSPGVPQDIAALSKAREKGIWVTGELELASRFIEAPIVAVTGTNGKSTVTSMIGHALTRGGMKAYVGGNIGTPLSALLAQETFCPRVAILLNITRDHLDRYRGFGEYVESKLRIFQNLGEGSCAIICDEDPIVSALDLGSDRRVFRYGLGAKKDRHAYVQKGSMVVRNGKSQYTKSPGSRPSLYLFWVGA
ncbi:MAG: hypothetical protein JRI39_10960 [Deltaproteobacteria bacterium]|nr:hypothetical protein [Deltaproteobacteria bacterium]